MKHNIEIDNVVFFDGFCNICNAGVNFLLKYSDTIKFASLQSEIAKKSLPSEYTNQNNLASLVYIKHGQLYSKSKAVFEMAANLNGWPKYILKVISVIPVPVANLIYNLIAKNRYRFAGKRTTCRLPSKEEISRFL